MLNRVFEEVYKVIFEVLEKNNRLERMVQEIAERLELSIVLTDSYGRIIAEGDKAQCSGKFKLGEETCIALIEEYCLSEGRESRVKKLQNGIQVMRAITVKDNIEGFCITLHVEEKEETALWINQMITRMIAVRFKLSGKTNHLDEPAAKQIVSRMLLGKKFEGESSPDINDKFYSTFVIEPFVLAVIDLKDKKERQTQKLRQKINEHFYNCLTYLEDAKLLVLFVDISTDDKKEEVYQFVKETLEETECVLALSDSFESAEEIAVKRKVLERIIEIAPRLNKEEKVLREYDYYLEFLCSYAYDAIGHKGYCDKQLTILEKEDAEKGTEFYKSLKEYLLCGNNVNLAAKKIFVHRNTMVYRLAKIHELMQVDINDPEVAKKLLFSMVLRSLR